MSVIVMIIVYLLCKAVHYVYLKEKHESCIAIKYGHVKDVPSRAELTKSTFSFLLVTELNHRMIP